MDAAGARTAVALAACLHAGFQATVTVLAYPALIDAAVVDPDPGRGTDVSPRPDWAGVHDRHSRRIVPLVGVVYALVAATAVWSLLAGPTVVEWVALVLVAGAPATTAVRAAPLHARLGATGPRAVLLVALRRADRLRAALAVAGAAVAVAALVTG